MSASNQVGAFNYAVPPFTKLQIKNITAAYTVVANDNGTIINCTSGTFTVSLTAAATLGAGFNVTIWNTSNTAANAITIDPNGAETIDGAATRILRRGEGMQIVCNGTNWETGDKKTMRGYAENLDSTNTLPSAAGENAISIGPDAVASAQNSLAISNPGSGATASGVGAIAINGTSSNTQTISLGRGTTASAAYATAIGQNSGNTGSQAVTGSGAMALGGSYASGTDSFAAAIANNTSTYGATGNNSVAIGRLAKATGASAYAFGSSSTGNVASGNNSFASGVGCTASNTSSIAMGSSSTASGFASVVMGASGNDNGVQYRRVYGSNTGVQNSDFILWDDTTDATPTVISTNGNAAGISAATQLSLPNSSAYSFTGTVVARQQAAGGTASAAWKVEGLIRREANAGTTTLVFSLVTAISNVPLWTLALTADTTNGGLTVTATGAAATNIRWVATIQTSECTYA